MPYKQSEQWTKEQCAFLQTPSSQEPGPTASWEVVRTCLRQMLESYYSEGSGVSISNIKRLFRLHFNMELSETALGHVRLLELLKDQRMSDVCSLQYQPNGQVMIMRASLSPINQPSQMIPPGMWASNVVIAPQMRTPSCLFNVAGEVLSTDVIQIGCPSPSAPTLLSSPHCSPRGDKPSKDDSLQWELHSNGSTEAGSFSTSSDAEDSEAEGSAGTADWVVCVKNTFIDIVTPTGGARLRQRSVPARLVA